LLSVALVLTAIPAVSTGKLEQSARKALLDHLDKSSADFRASIQGLTADQWNYKPSPEVWSVSECAEHIVLTEDLLREMIANKVLATPATPERVAERSQMDAKVLAMITDRSYKAKAPEMLVPTRRFATPDDALREFQARREKTVAFAKSRDDFREHAVPHPMMKEVDAYQWLLYLSGHTMRHTAQILEVKAGAAFPSKK
jgi:uncharacterized damage-inducible protein DinB